MTSARMSALATCCRPCGASHGAAAAHLGAAGFQRDRSRRAVDERPLRTRLRPALPGHGTRARYRQRAADDGGCARLRCAGRRGAGGLGRGAAARSRGKPQADARSPGLRRHRAFVAACGHSVAVDGGDAMDRARGAFAAGGEVACVGRTALRRRACPQPSWPARTMDHGMGMR